MRHWKWNSTEIYGSSMRFFFTNPEGGKQDIHLDLNDAIEMIIHFIRNFFFLVKKQEQP